MGPAEMQSFEVTAIESDSRKVPKGGLFVAIKGERVDGHKFIDQVIANGAAAVLSEIDLGEKPFPYIRVGSSLQAVKDIAEFYLKQLHIPVIGIAGSVGKTSTKEMAYSVLRQKFNVLKTEGNFNNELGVPLTIFRLRDEHEMAVLEMGISDFGEMHRLAKIVRPNTVIMTNIGYCHLENLIDRDGILKAKTEIFDFLESDAHIILNGDDDKLATITDVRGIKPVTFGFAPERDIWADELKSLGLKGTACHFHTPVGDFHATVGMPGRHMVANALAGTAVGLAYGLTLDQIKTGIEANESLSGRFNIIDTDRYTIIDDCYNANPQSVTAALEILAKTECDRKIAVLGDMGELGALTDQAHYNIGALAAMLGIDQVFAVGAKAAKIAEGTENSGGQVWHFATKEEALASIRDSFGDNTVMLIKASHAMHFGWLVEQLSR